MASRFSSFECDLTSRPCEGTESARGLSRRPIERSQFERHEHGFQAVAQRDPHGLEMVFEAKRREQVAFDVDIAAEVGLHQPQRIAVQNECAHGSRVAERQDEARLAACARSLARLRAHLERRTAPEPHRDGARQLRKDLAEQLGSQCLAAISGGNSRRRKAVRRSACVRGVHLSGQRAAPAQGIRIRRITHCCLLGTLVGHVSVSPRAGSQDRPNLAQFVGTVRRNQDALGT